MRLRRDRPQNPPAHRPGRSGADCTVSKRHCWRALLALAAGGTSFSACAGNVPALADGPDLVASASIVNVSGGNLSCFGGMRNQGNVATTATLAVSCPGLVASWTCSGSGGASCQSSGSPVVNANMPAGSSIGLMAGGTVPSGTYTITSTVSAAGDIDTSNNSATSSVIVTAPPRPISDLSTVLRSYPSYATYGQPVEYEVEVENFGPAPIELNPSGGAHVILETRPGLSALAQSCTVLTAGAQCQVSSVDSASVYFQILLPVGGKLLVRRSVTIPAILPSYSVDSLKLTTRIRNLYGEDNNLANQHPEVTTPVSLFRHTFELPDGEVEPTFE